MLKKVELGPSGSIDLAKRPLVDPDDFSPLGGSAEIAETNKKVAVIKLVKVFLIVIKFSTVLISELKYP
jgi:hypothetical protein|tara:strand:+ start:213 stop:419 length:207 start_codon:yes stop_codon:yes gene_type:complete